MSQILSNFHVQWIPLKRLSVVWIGAQRPYNEAWAQTIADNFDPDLFEHLIVTQADTAGLYHTVDGQHRASALKKYAAKLNKNGDGSNELAPCRVIPHADPAKAAQIWLGVNQGRKAVKPISEFQIAVVAEYPQEVAINKLVGDMGYTVCSNTTVDNAIAAVSALRKVHNRYGIDILKIVLQATRALWGADPKAVSGPMLRGFGIFFNEFSGHVNLARLQKHVSTRFSPFQFIAAAKTRKQSTQVTLEVAIAENLVREYNRGLKGARLERKS
jgi:hypothetical protein